MWIAFPLSRCVFRFLSNQFYQLSNSQQFSNLNTNSKHRFTIAIFQEGCQKAMSGVYLRTPVYNILLPRGYRYRKAMSGVQLQALVYNIFFSKEEDAGKRCRAPSCTGLLPGYFQGRRVPESDVWRPTQNTGLQHPSSKGEGCRKVTLGVWPGVCIVNSTHALDLSQ